MKKQTIFCLLFLIAPLMAVDLDSLRVWVNRPPVSPQTIYYEGAGGGDTAKVTIRAWASPDTLKAGIPLDIILLVDRSWSMRTVDSGAHPYFLNRSPGQKTTKPPISRIQGAYNAAANLVTKHLKSTYGVRTAFLAVSQEHYLPLMNDTVSYCIFKSFKTSAEDPGYTSFLNSLDANLIAIEAPEISNGCGGSSNIRTAINDAITYGLAYKRAEATPMIIAITDARLDEGASDYNTDTLVNRLTALNAGADPAVLVYTIAVSDGDTTALRRIADAGKGAFSFSPTGSGVDSILNDIGQTTLTAAAIQIKTGATTTPMFIDVLGKDIHYVPNSLIIRSYPDSTHYIDSNHVNKSFSTINTYTGSHGQFTFYIDTINVGQILQVEYKITAALREFNPTYLTTGKPMAVNNYKQDDSVAYSRFKYMTLNGTIFERPIVKSIVYVKTKVAGTFISTRGDSLVPPDPLGNKTVTLMYSAGAPDDYGPQNLYGIQKVDATGISQYTNTSVYWSFTPLSGWTLTGDPAVDFTQAPTAFRLFGISIVGDSGKQGKDTLKIKSVDGTYTDHLTVNAVYVDKQFIAGYRMDPVSPAAAGAPLSVTWKAVDVAGNVVTNPLLLPDKFCVRSDQPVRIIRAPGDTLTLNGGADRICLDNPFQNGVMTTQFYSTVAESLNIDFIISKGLVDTTKSASIVFLPAAPDHVRLVYVGGATDAVRDTLSTFGSENSTQRSYAALLFDSFENPITDPAILEKFQWQAVHEPDNLAQSSADVASYKALNSAGNFLDTLYVSYVDNGQTRFRDSVIILVLPIVKVLSVTTHEWIPSIDADPDLVKFVLDSVLLVSTDSLNTAATAMGLSQGDMYLRELRAYGYNSARDGYLDYLDITLSTGIMLKGEFITGLFFDTLVSGADTVKWALEKRVNGRTLHPKLTALDNVQTLYRLWLIPNALNPDAPLETGFLPKIRFNNSAIQYENMPPLRLGTADNEYLTSAGIVKDSAAPVVDRFLYQNNKCDQDRKLNTAQIAFSEPVLLSPGSFVDLRALTLQNGITADSVFMLTAVNDAAPINVDYSPLQAWNKESAPAAMMTYEVEVRTDREDLFKENISKMRFSVDAGNRQITDIAGNSGCLGNNLPATLENDVTKSAVCNVTGLTVVNRYDAMGFTWGVSDEPGTTGEEVPLFPFFGFEVNLSLLGTAGNGRTQSLITSTCGNYILVDYDPTTVFVSSEVMIFDLLGNLTASSATNKSLKVEYSLNDVKRYLKMDSLSCSAVDTSRYILLRGQGGAKDTIMPRYPSTLPIGYEFMKQNKSQRGVPSWNCLNAKGRLVAPGGYIVSQQITALGKTEKITKKLIVTSKRKGKTL